MDLWNARTVAIEAAEAAGERLKRDGHRPAHIRAKSEGDVLTSLDLASEKIVIDRIRAAYPHHRIISEEMGVLDGDDRWCWVVDPLDGTNNLAIGLAAY